MRFLETETHELKELLDEKDEKLEMLSKMRTRSPAWSSPRRQSATPDHKQAPGDREQDKDTTLRVAQTAVLLSASSTGADPYFTGNSSTRALISKTASVLVQSHD